MFGFLQNFLFPMSVLLKNETPLFPRENLSKQAPQFYFQLESEPACTRALTTRSDVVCSLFCMCAADKLYPAFLKLAEGAGCDDITIRRMFSENVKMAYRVGPIEVFDRHI